MPLLGPASVEIKEDACRSRGSRTRSERILPRPIIQPAQANHGSVEVIHLLDIVHFHQELYDRLGLDAWDGRTAYVMDGDEFQAHDSKYEQVEHRIVEEERPPMLSVPAYRKRRGLDK